MTYEWNDAKNQLNIRNHGIDFLDVPSMFQHPMVTFLDQRRDYDEDRWVGIGILRTLVVVVVFTERGTDTMRIISARKATRNEEKIYRNEI
jgi:hypothetical protein